MQYYSSPCGRLAASLIGKCCSTSISVLLRENGWVFHPWSWQRTDPVQEIPCQNVFTVIRDPDERLRSGITQILHNSGLSFDQLSDLEHKDIMLHDGHIQPYTPFLQTLGGKAIVLPMSGNLDQLMSSMFKHFDINMRTELRKINTTEPLSDEEEKLHHRYKLKYERYFGRTVDDRTWEYFNQEYSDFSEYDIKAGRQFLRREGAGFLRRAS